MVNLLFWFVDFEVKGDVSNFEAKQPILEQGFFFL